MKIPRMINFITCICGEDHAIYSYDIPGEFLCTCGIWLKYQALTPDYDAQIKDDKIDFGDKK